MTATATLTPAETAEVETLRATAAGHIEAEAESFHRCDTDGFVSQWAHTLSAREAQAKATLIENGGTVDTVALFLADGTLASTHLHYGQWGASWVLNDTAAAVFGKRFLNRSKANTGAARHAALLRKGFTEGTIRVRGEVVMEGSGRGFSGLASVHVVTRPVVADMMAGEFEILTTDRGPQILPGEED